MERMELSNRSLINLALISYSFLKCENAILSHIDFQINKYNNNFQYQKCKRILNNISVKEDLENFQLLVVSTDKATNNVAFIRKRFYATALPT